MPELPLERQEVAFGVVPHAGTVAVQDGEIDEFELVFELIFLHDLMEEPGDVCRRVGEGAAAHGREHQ